MELHPIGVNNLCHAIIEYSADDYKKSIREIMRDGHGTLSKEAIRSVTFFNSEYFKLMAFCDGWSIVNTERLLKKMQAQVYQDELEKLDRLLHEPLKIRLQTPRNGEQEKLSYTPSGTLKNAIEREIENYRLRLIDEMIEKGLMEDE